MNSFITLTKAQLIQAFSINTNRRKKKKDLKATSFKAGLLALGALMIFISVYLNVVFYTILQPEGLQRYLPGIMFFFASLMALITTISKINGVVFNCKDFDVLMAMPLKPTVIVSSKLVSLYLYELFFAYVFMTPAIILYGITDPMAILPGLVMVLTLPVIPLALAAILSFLITLLGSLFKHKAAITSILYIVYFVALMAFSMMMSSMFSSDDPSNFTSLFDKMFKAYPIAELFVKGCIELDIPSLAIFLAVNIGILAIVVGIIGKCYSKINHLLKGQRVKIKYVRKEMKMQSPIKALLSKENKTYFGYPIYMLNTIIGAIMGIIIAVVFGLVINADITIENGTAEDIELMKNIMLWFSPVVITFPCSMATITQSSISMEGKTFWITKSAPLSANQVLGSKLLYNDIVLGGIAIISSIILLVLGRFTDPFIFISVLLFPVLYTCGIGCIGLLLNLAFPKLNWENPIQACKNSAPALLCMLFGALTLLPLIAITFLGFINSALVLIVGLTYLLLFNLVVHCILKNYGPKKYKTIQN